MKHFLTAGLVGLTLLLAGSTQARADGFNFSYHLSGTFGFSFSPTCGGSGGSGGAYGCCPDPYASCAYAPYFQYGWPQSMPVYPGVAPGYNFAPTPWVLPPSPYIGPANVPQPYYWNPR